MLSHDQLRQKFDDDGFVIIRELYSPTEVDELKGQVDRYIREIVPTLNKDAAFYDDYSRPETLRKMQALDRHDAWFQNFMKQSRHTQLLDYFLRDGFHALGLEWFNKLPYDQSATPAHQDGFYFCRKPNNACGLWIALDPVDEANSCIWYGRGTHKRGILPHAPTGVLGFSQGLIDFDKSLVDGVPAVLAPGDAVAHHSATIHWTGPNETDRSRRAIALLGYGDSTELDEEAHNRHQSSLKQQLSRRGIVSGV